MTIDTELRDALTSVAQGPAAGAGWDDVVRRGRHRQRVRRARGTVLGALIAGGVVAGIALAADDPTVETVPPATAPPSSVSEGTAPLAMSTTTVPIPDDGRPHIQAGRAQHVFLTVIIPWADPSKDFDPCVDLHPRVVESQDQVGIELMAEEVEGTDPWADCQASPFSARGLIELLDPLGERSVVDLTTGNAVFVADPGSLLFPSALPAPFDLGQWDEFASQGSWMFSWSADDLYVNVTTGYGGTNECDREAVEVRGAEGRLCRSEDGHFDLHWEEGGPTIAIELGHVGGEPSPFTLQDVLAIAEGLKPLGASRPS